MRRVALALAALLSSGGAACGPRGAAPAPAPSGSAPAPAAGVAPAGGVLPPGLRVAPDPAAIQAIAAAARHGSHLEEDLAWVTDVIGPRLTGSPAMRRANAWALERLRAYGVDSAWTESYRFGQAWERGPLALSMLAPSRRELAGASVAWAPGTEKPVTGDVTYMDAKSLDELDLRFHGHLSGRWVLIVPPVPMRNPDAPAPSTRDSIALDSARRAYYAPPATQDEATLRRRLFAILAQEGALGVIGEGEKPYGLLRTFGSPDRLFPLPYVIVAHDAYGELFRLVRAGERVTLRGDVVNTLSPDTVSAENTIAEIRGSEKPEEIVLLAAHLDSWDLGTGATDNAAGAAAVIEAARILHDAGVRPRRTIRFALFSGEEQGLYGSESYVETHLASMDRYQAVLVLDNGTGRITGMSLQGNEATRPLWDALFSPIADLGPFTVLSRNKGGSDHRPFIARGVPGFNFDQASRGYDFSWHSQADTREALLPAEVSQGATVMAATAYELANLPGLLPRVPAR